MFESQPDIVHRTTCSCYLTYLYTRMYPQKCHKILPTISYFVLQNKKSCTSAQKRCREDTIFWAFLVGCRRLVIFGIRQDIKMAGLSGACSIILIKFILKFFSCYFFLLRQTLFLFCQKTKEVKGTVAQEKLFN